MDKKYIQISYSKQLIRERVTDSSQEMVVVVSGGQCWLECQHVVNINLAYFSKAHPQR